MLARSCFFCVFALLGLACCHSSDRSQAANPAAPHSASGGVGPQSAHSAASTVVAKGQDYEMCHHDDYVKLSLVTPDGFVRSKNNQFIGLSKKSPTDEFRISPSLQFSTGGYACNGECKDDDYLRELNAMIDGAIQSATVPNRNTGRPELDAVRLSTTKAERWDIPNGKCIRFEVTVPANVNGPYHESLNIVCGIHRKGDSGWVALSASSLREDIASAEPQFKAAIKSVSIRSFEKKPCETK